MPHLSTYVGLADHSERTLADSLRAVADGHASEADVFTPATCSRSGAIAIGSGWRR
jgi:hypothetical protein